MRHAFPPEQTDVLSDTVFSLELSDPAVLRAVAKMERIMAARPSFVGNAILRRIVPEIAWAIADAGGEFIGPNYAG